MSRKEIMSRKERRPKLQIYFDVLRAIADEIAVEGVARPTRVQFRSNMSYDKLSRYLLELENKKLINKKPTMSLTNKGQNFMRDYDKINDFIEKLGLDYLNDSEDEVT